MDLFKMFSKDTPSKDVAKERLKLILIHDRADISPRFLDMIKGDIIRVISNYAEIDGDIKIEIVKEPEGNKKSTALVANIPIKKMKETK